MEMTNGNGFRVTWAAISPILGVVGLVAALFAFVRLNDLKAIEGRQSMTERAIAQERSDRKDEVDKLYRLLERMDAKLDTIQRDLRK